MVLHWFPDYDYDYDLNSLNLEQLPEFYRTLLCYWQELKLSTDSKEIPVYDQIIWNNRNIRLDGKTIFNTEWYKKGIIYIHDLLNADFNFLSLTEFKKKKFVQCAMPVYKILWSHKCHSKNLEIISSQYRHPRQ